MRCLTEQRRHDQRVTELPSSAVLHLVVCYLLLIRRLPPLSTLRPRIINRSRLNSLTEQSSTITVIMAGQPEPTYADFLRKLARRTKLNEQSILAYIASLVAIASVFILLHLVRQCGERLRAAQREGKKPSALASLSR